MFVIRRLKKLRRSLGPDQSTSSEDLRGMSGLGQTGSHLSFDGVDEKTTPDC